MTYSTEAWEEKRVELLGYLKNNPKAKVTDVLDAGYGSTLAKIYNGSLKDARMESGMEKDDIPEKSERVTPREWDRRKGVLKKYLENNPGASHSELPIGDCRTALTRFYGGSLNAAKKDFGIDEEHIYKGFGPTSEEEWELREVKLLEYLSENPDSSMISLKGTGHENTIHAKYGGSINDAKEIAGVSPEYFNPGFPNPLSPREWEMRRQALIAEIRRNPGLGFNDLNNLLKTAVLSLYGSINKAKKAVGVDPVFITPRSSLDEEIWENRKEVLRDLFANNPEAAKGDIKEAGLESTLNKFFNGSLNVARETFGLDTGNRNSSRYTQMKFEKRMVPLTSYNPEVLGADFIKRENSRMLMHLAREVLTDKEMTVLACRFGYGMTLGETGNMIKRTHEMARQIESRCVGKIQRVCKREGFLDLVEGPSEFDIETLGSLMG